jgi:SAM-dependent methyltransferase
MGDDAAFGLPLTAATGPTTAGVARLYRGQPARLRLYIAARRALLPIAALEARLPKSGRILDAGCGYGLLTNYVAMRSPERSVLGIDLAPDRIDVARTAASGLNNVRFEVMDLLELEAESMDAVLLVDTLHYFPRAEQAAILQACRRALVPGGLLVCRNAVREWGPRFWWNWMHETFMVRTGLTRTHSKRLHFLTLADVSDVIRGAGFDLSSVEQSSEWLPYTDRVFVARATVARTASLT